MEFMLDTNICSYILKKHPASVKVRFDEAGRGELAISTVVLAELYYGAARHARGAEIRREIDDFASRLDIADWDEVAADRYGSLRAELEQQGTPMGAMDLMIAAHAASRGATLVTNNARHFEKVRDLPVVNWA